MRSRARRCTCRPRRFERPDGVDARSDLYAVGAVGYFLLTGQPPFHRTDAIEICMHHVKTPPERPADRIKLPLADDLQEVILKGLAKKPEDRFDSALEFRRGPCQLPGRRNLDASPGGCLVGGSRRRPHGHATGTHRRRNWRIRNGKNSPRGDDGDGEVGSRHARHAAALSSKHRSRRPPIAQ